MNVTGECCKTSEQLPNPPVTLLVDILLNPFCMVSQHLMCRTFTFAGPMLFNYIPLLGLILNMPQGDRQSKMKKTPIPSHFS